MDTLLVLARTLHIGSALLFVSLIFFQKIILPPEEKSSAPPGWHDAVTRRLGKWATGTFVIHLLSGAGWLWIVVAQMNDSSWGEALDENLFRIVLTQTQFGQLWTLRCGLAVGLGVVLFLGRRVSSGQPGWTAFAFGASLLGSLSWAGHAASGVSYRALHIGIDFAHLAIAAVWPVGLIPLAIFLFTLSGRSDAVPVSILMRFSRVSLLGAILIFLTGLASALFLVSSLNALFTSDYGQLLLVKFVLFLGLVGIGARNRFQLLPAFTRNSSAPVRLRRSVLAESILCLIVLLIVGALGTAPPPASF